MSEPRDTQESRLPRHMHDNPPYKSNAKSKGMFACVDVCPATLPRNYTPSSGPLAPRGKPRIGTHLCTILNMVEIARHTIVYMVVHK